MSYQSQKLALHFFGGALLLFVVQVSFGLLAATVYVLPNFLAELVPFHILRMIHTNALIVWLLLAFMGATYFLLPEEAEREIASRPLAIAHFWILLVAALVAVAGYLFRIHEGREFLEQPLWIKIVIVVAFLMFLYNVTVTWWRGRKTAVASILLLGLWTTALFFLFALYNPVNLSVDKTLWWYTIHLWVENTFELILIAFLGYLVLKLTAVDRDNVEKWLYVLASLVIFSGLLGTGHHYYWIGTPGYWQWIGNVFSTLEVVPFFGFVLFVFYSVWNGRRDHPNKAAVLWLLGCVVFGFFGAGVWGFMHTLSFINYYSHGTQVTAAHGHHAFYGAYVMISVAMMTYALPYLRDRPPYNRRLNMWAFWIVSGAVAFMTFTLTFAGVVQVHLQRVRGELFMDVQDELGLFYWMRWGAGLVLVLGVLLLVGSLVLARREKVKAA